MAMQFDPLNMPLFMQSGMMDAPPQQGPMGGGMENYEQLSPFELAAMRQRQTVMPQQGRADMSPETIAQILAMAAPVGRAAGAVGQGVAAAPKLAGSLMAGGASLLGMGGAGEAADQVDPRQGEINQIMTRIDKAQGEITRLGTTRTPSPKGTQELTIRTLQESITRDAARMRELQDTLNAEDAAKRQAEKPFREEYPGAYRMLPLAGWAASALGGAVGAKAGQPLRSALGGAAAGVPTSVAAAVGPTAYDAAVLPTGSKHQKEAADWLVSPEYWAGRVAPEVLVGSTLGASTGNWGAKLRRTPSAPPLSLPGSPAGQAAGAPTLGPQSGMPSLSAPPLGLPAPPRRPTFTDASGRLRYADDGRFAPRGQ